MEYHKEKMMKTIIGLDGNPKEVSDDVPVKTVDGVHYELTASDQAEIDAREADALAFTLAALPGQLRRAIDGSIINVDGVEELGGSKTRNAIAETLQFIEALGANAPATVEWSAENGFHTLTVDQVRNLGIQIGLRRQKAFAAKKTLKEEIANGTITTVEAAKTRFSELMA